MRPVGAVWLNPEIVIYFSITQHLKIKMCMYIGSDKQLEFLSSA